MELDAKRREIIQKVEALRHKQRLAGEEIARKGKAKEDTSALKAEMKTVSDDIKSFDGELAAIETKIDNLMLVLPNIPDASVPRGDASAKTVVRKTGEPRTFDFEPKLHGDIGAALGIIDFERAPKISGARFSSLWGMSARLERALIQFMLDLHTKERVIHFLFGNHQNVTVYQRENIKKRKAIFSFCNLETRNFTCYYFRENTCH